MCVLLGSSGLKCADVISDFRLDFRHVNIRSSFSPVDYLLVRLYCVQVYKSRRIIWIFVI